MLYQYFIYIITNPAKTVLYIGVTNNLRKRLQEHFENKGKPNSFAGRYFCYNLVYWERFENIIQAINREKELKKWSRTKKEQLINKFNPDWRILDDEV